MLDFTDDMAKMAELVDAYILQKQKPNKNLIASFRDAYIAIIVQR